MFLICIHNKIFQACSRCKFRDVVSVSIYTLRLTMVYVWTPRTLLVWNRLGMALRLSSQGYCRVRSLFAVDWMVVRSLLSLDRRANEIEADAREMSLTDINWEPKSNIIAWHPIIYLVEHL